MKKNEELDPDLQKLFDKWDRWAIEAEEDRKGNPNHPDVIIYDGLCGTGKTRTAYSLVNTIHNLSVEHTNLALEADEINIKPIPTFIFVAPTIMECHRLAGSIPVEIPLGYEDLYKGYSFEGVPLEVSDKNENDKDINKEQRRTKNGEVIYLRTEKEIKNKPPLVAIKPVVRDFIIPPVPKNNTDGSTEVHRTRLDSIKAAVRVNQDIAISHSAFLRFDKELISLIKQRNYHLIIDEVPNPFGKITDILEKDVSSNDINNLFNEGNIVVGEDDVISWRTTDTVKKWDVFGGLKKHIDEKRVIHYSDKGSIFFQRSIPELYKSFKSARILTYIFDGSICKSYFELYGIKYVTRNFRNKLNEPIKYWELIELAKSNNKDLKELDERSLSQYWFSKKKYDDLEFLRNATSSFFKNKCKESSSNEKLWTCYKAHIELCQEKGYINSWLYITARGTNLYRHVNAMAYLVNRHPSTPIKNYFSRKAKEKKNSAININIDKYALGELIQWVFRSQIRDEKPIKLFLPSLRMQNLLEDWFIEMGKPVKMKIKKRRVNPKK